jgi:hypothetical protein
MRISEKESDVSGSVDKWVYTSRPASYRTPHVEEIFLTPSLNRASNVASKTVTFQYTQAQLGIVHMRTNIYPKGSTDAISTTVKDSFGIEDRSDINFEDKYGSSLVPHYDNLEDNEIVFVRVLGEALAAPPDDFKPPSPYQGPFGHPLPYGCVHTTSEYNSLPNPRPHTCDTCGKSYTEKGFA